MNFEEFNKKFKSYVLSLSSDQQLYLAVSICKKLFSDYQEFCLENNWGDSDYLLDLINSLQDPNQQKYSEQIFQKLESIAPDSDDFGNASYAINACSAVFETMKFCQDKNPNHIIAAGTCLTDTIDFKIQEEDEFSDEEIDNHSMMIEARKFLLNESV